MLVEYIIYNIIKDPTLSLLLKSKKCYTINKMYYIIAANSNTIKRPFGGNEYLWPMVIIIIIIIMR